jgi:hypothetical protein
MNTIVDQLVRMEIKPTLTQMEILMNELHRKEIGFVSLVLDSSIDLRVNVVVPCVCGHQFHSISQNNPSLGLLFDTHLSECHPIECCGFTCQSKHSEVTKTVTDLLVKLKISFTHHEIETQYLHVTPQAEFLLFIDGKQKTICVFLAPIVCH